MKETKEIERKETRPPIFNGANLFFPVSQGQDFYEQKKLVALRLYFTLILLFQNKRKLKWNYFDSKRKGKSRENLFFLFSIRYFLMKLKKKTKRKPENCIGFQGSLIKKEN
mmetsp:Transcript_24979/g.34455  ORF Transcript_24979/g.34455 Transcript_24979/m.34455 type:complete len:111 (+) Transcript_24979:1181-1513(+)